MLFNHLNISWRRLKKQKTYTLINCISLALGITSALSILLYIQDETSYDRFHEKQERIVRLTRWFTPDFKIINHFARCPYAWQPWMEDFRQEYPEIESVARLSRKSGIVLRIGENLFSEKNFFLTDKEIFQVFSIPLSAGDNLTALNIPYSIILTESMAKKYVNGNAMGQVLYVIDDQGNKIPYKITGLMKDWPENSHIRVDFLASSSGQNMDREWAYTYLLLREHTDYRQLEQKFPDFVRHHFEGVDPDRSKFFLQKLTDIHLSSHLDRELEVNGDGKTINVLWIAALLIILITCVNYTNLVVAQALRHAKEINIRRVIGSSKGQLAVQFLTETALITVTAGMLSLITTQLLLPEINSLTGKYLVLQLSVKNILLFVGFIGILGFVTGVYPAFIISRTQLFERNKPTTLSFLGTRLKLTPRRNVLVILQFCISACLMICALIIRGQLNYIAQKPLGLNKDCVINIGKDLPQQVRAKYQVLRNQLMQNSHIVNVCASMQEPSSEIKDMGECSVESIREGNNTVFLYILPVDEHFFDLMEIQIVHGQQFPSSNVDYESMTFSPNDNFIKELDNAPRSYILNEAAVKHIGFSPAEKAIDKHMDWRNELIHLKQGPIIGVVKDFHFSTLHKEIVPYVLVCEPRFCGSILVKLKSENISSTMKEIERTWIAMFPETPFEFNFLDDLYGELYVNERQLENVSLGFSFLAILIACLGLIGLVSYSAEERTKEIGIRKVLGSSATGILYLLVQSYIKWIIIGNIIAWPIAYLLMKKWLQDFAYRIDLSLWPFLLSGMFALIVALLTVIRQTVRAASSNPVECLKYE
jgi:putative ABC transport system permease protein